ncbi:MAG: tRNA-guanine transglycosylase [Candidatus Bathycorpusculaceae bacterium]
MSSLLRLSFKEYNRDGFARTGSAQTWKREISTPTIWFGLSVIENYDFQHEVLSVNKVECFLANAYDLLFQDKNGERKRLIRDLATKMCFKCDSGGFQTTKRKTELTVDHVYSLQRELECDIAVQLDFPLNPQASKESNRSRVDKTLKNLEKVLAINDKLSILPVIHGYDRETLDYALIKVKDILGQDPLAIGVGSLVPLLMTSKGSGKVGGKRKVIDTLIYLRQRLPETFLHVFGAGGTMAYLITFCGADSFDYVGWVQKAGYGVIQLPGVSDRFLSKRKKRKNLNGEEKKKFLECSCPACRFHSLTEFQDRSPHSRLLRAIHNVYVYQTEIWRMRESIKSGVFREFVFDRLKNSTWNSLLRYADAQLVRLGVYPSKYKKIDTYL